MGNDSLDGIWMHIKGKDEYGEVRFAKFAGSQQFHFGISNVKKNIIHLKKWKVIESESIVSPLFMSENHFKIIKKGVRSNVYSDKVITEEIDVEVNYTKMIPTKTSLSKEEIQKMRFQANWNKEKIDVIFNEILDKDFIQEMNAMLKREGRKIILEQFHDTLFLSFFDNNERERLVPIKEIDNEKIILTGFPEKPFEIIGERMN